MKRFVKAARVATSGLLLSGALLLFAGCAQQNQAPETESPSSDTTSSTEVEQSEPEVSADPIAASEGKEETSMLVTIEGAEYGALLNDTLTAEDILGMTPLSLTMQRFAEHEYYAELPSRPIVEGMPTTSHIVAGGIYYWHGWNAFVFNYIESDIAPYEVVQVGTFDESLNDYLLNSAPETIEVSLSAEDF